MRAALLGKMNAAATLAATPVRGGAEARDESMDAVASENHCVDAPVEMQCRGYSRGFESRNGLFRHIAEKHGSDLVGSNHGRHVVTDDDSHAPLYSTMTSVGSGKSKSSSNRDGTLSRKQEQLLKVSMIHPD